MRPDDHDLDDRIGEIRGAFGADERVRDSRLAVLPGHHQHVRPYDRVVILARNGPVNCRRRCRVADQFIHQKTTVSYDVVAFDYGITGTWTDPKVAKLGVEARAKEGAQEK